MTMEIVITIVASVLASSGLWQFIILKTNRKSTQTKALLALLHNEIYSISESALKRGYITTEDLDNLTCLYLPYRELDGNGTGQILYEKVKNLPQSIEEEKEK